MSIQTKSGNFPSTSCATSQEAQESHFTGQSPISALKVTLLSSEWRSTKGGLSTINRELAIQLAKHSNVEVSMYLPQCSEEDKRAAAAHNVCIIKAEEKPGYDPIDWLATIPRDHQMDFVIGHGIHLGRQVPLIKEVHRQCKWVQVVHTDPEELGMFKICTDSIAKGEKKHKAEVGLCKLADLVVAIGPKLDEAFSCYLRPSGKDQDVLTLTPGIFSEFADVTQAAEERRIFRVLVFGRGDSDDFYLKGCDIAAHAVAKLCKHQSHLFKLVFVGAPKGEEEKVKQLLLKEGIAPSQLIVRSYKEREQLAVQFCEADLAIMPSRSEGFGLAALEALSAGLPVLVSGNSGFGDALKDCLFGSTCVLYSEDARDWAKAIRAIHHKERKLRLLEAVDIRERYAERYHWEVECGRLVERMVNIIQAPDQAVAAVNLGEEGPSSVSESVSYPDATTIQHIVGDAVSSGRENVIRGEGPRTDLLTTTEGREGLNAGIPEISSDGRSVLKQERRPSHLHPSATPPVMEQRHDIDIRRVFTHNSVVVKLLRDQYNRRAKLRPLFWVNSMQLPLEKVYTRLKIVSRQRGGIQGETKCWGDAIWAEDSRRDEILAEARANKVNPCDVFGLLKENKDVMTIVEGSPGIGKTTFCLRLAYDWANQSSSAASLPEFELVLLLKCRDIDEDLTEAITGQLFGSNLSKDASEELFRFLEDIENQERVLIILDGLDELPEKSKRHVDKLLHRKRWAFCYVLATTRQEKGIEVRQQPEFVFDLFLQIEGFTEEDSYEYIRKHFKIAGPEHSSKGEKLIEEIKQNVLLKDLRTTPLNLLLLCVVYEDHKGELPSSRTDLYHVIFVCLLRRYCAKHDVKPSEKDGDLETQFEREISCLGKLAWNCLLNDRHSFFEEELEELESRSEKLVIRDLGFVYKEESLKLLMPQHEYCFLHKSFEEYLAASYIAHKLRRNEFNVFEHLNFDAVVKKFRHVFVFVCGILREEASILFKQIGEELKSDWDWLNCSKAEGNFFIDSWSESGNAEGMATTLCSFMPFPRVVDLPRVGVNEKREWVLLRVLSFCGQFSKVETPVEIRLGAFFSPPPFIHSGVVRDLASLTKLKFLDFCDCFLDVKSAHKLFQRLPEFASLTELALPDVPEMSDWGIVTKALTTSTTLEIVGCVLLGERGEGWARALDAGLCADTPLSSVNLRICGPMSETGLQALGSLFLNKSLSFVFVIVKGDMSHSLAVTLSRALAGQTVVKSLELRVYGKLSFCCANLIEQGIDRNNTLSNFVLCLHGELPDNWPTIVENLNAQLAEKSTVTFEIYPNTLSLVSATQLTDFRPFVITYGSFQQESVTLNVWGELTVDGAEALYYNVLRCTCVRHLKLNIHGKVTDDFLHCTARHVDKQKPLCPITINTWEQLTNEGKALFKELELDRNPAVTLNVCEVQLPSDESGDHEIVSINTPASLIALLVSAENTGKENLAVTINVQSGKSTSDSSDDSVVRSWNDSLLLGLPRNCSLNSLTLTINNFSPRSSELSFTLISFLESCISLKSLNLTLNEYNTEWANTCASRLREGLGRNTSLISLTLTLNIFARQDRRPMGSYFGFHSISDDNVVPNISINSFTLTINDFSSGALWAVSSGVLWSNCKSLHTLNVTLNKSDEESDYSLRAFFDVAMEVNSLRTLRLKINDLTFRNALYPKYMLSRWEVKNPSLEFIELTICHYGDVGSWLETVEWEKQ
ncbi:uncharacterized protein [Acropora muricata]|uniref:uncharacterized protein isoform X3 n=1 Tax=Acropora muricata TaxID=159855 RepID=UPI0034E43B09